MEVLHCMVFLLLFCALPFVPFVCNVSIPDIIYSDFSWLRHVCLEMFVFETQHLFPVPLPPVPPPFVNVPLMRCGALS